MCHTLVDIETKIRIEFSIFVPQIKVPFLSLFGRQKESTRISNTYNKEQFLFLYDFSTRCLYCYRIGIPLSYAMLCFIFVLNLLTNLSLQCFKIIISVIIKVSINE